MSKQLRLNWLAAGLVVVAGAAAGAAESNGAKAVLKASGAGTGLCLHLGCGGEKAAGLTAELAAASGMLVHGLALDEAALARARKAIAARGVAGRAMVELLREKRLPYLPGLARLVVVEDMSALGARGISKAEILRVVCPGGVLCVKLGGGWTVSTKPRPKEMGEWTHTSHGADGNLVSEDKAVSFPISLRWIDGTPFGRGGFGSCAPCRAVALSAGRCFAVSVDDPGREKTAVLTARDAHNGLPLWSVDVKGTYSRVQLDWRNAWPLVATAERVYTRRGEKLIIVKAVSGEVEKECETEFTPRRLVVAGGAVITACWEKMEVNNAKDRFENDSLRAVWWPAGRGSLEAFDPASGSPRWKLPLKVLTLAASEKTAYALTHEGNPPVSREVVAVDIASGKEKWRVSHTVFGEEADTCLCFAGPGCAVVSKTKTKGKREVFVLNEADGKVRFSLPGTTARHLVGGQLWCSDGRYDLASGKKVPGPGIGNTYAGGNAVGGCVPPIVVGERYVTGSRRGGFLKLADSPGGRPTKLSYSGARGACIQGMIPGNGMFYTAQNNCGCFGAQPGGFLAIGPGGVEAAETDFTNKRPVEKGPAFGAVKPLAAKPDDWVQYRGNAERSGGSKAVLPEKLRVVWKQKCVAPGEGQIGEAWHSRAAAPQPLTGPIVVGGTVIVCGLDTGEVIARDAAGGTEKWRALLGSRIDSPPAYHGGLLLVGCRDGWVHALRAGDGALAYRVRIAPRESRMVVNGQVESVWPAVGAVLVHDGVAFATAGRSTRTDGGIAVVAFKPETGETVWARALGSKYTLLVDTLSVRGNELAFHWLRLDPETGKELPPAQVFYRKYSMISAAWAAGFSKRSGRGFQLGKACASMMAWNDRLVAWGDIAVKRAQVECPKPNGKAKAKHPDRVKREDLAWSAKLEPHSAWAKVKAMALSGNAALYAGGVMTYGRTYSGSFLWVKSAKDGGSVQKAVKLEARPCYDSLAISGGRAYLCLQDGTLVCFGK